MAGSRRIRMSSGPAAKGTQKTLAFGNKVTKSTTTSKSDKPFSVAPAALAKVVTDHEVSKDVGHVSSDAVVAQQTQIELEKENKSEEELKASKVTDAQVKKYWKVLEAERRYPRAHQKDLGVEEKILRFWDMSEQFGPAIGIARVKRWVRANKLGLNPPIEVLAVLLKEETKGNSRIERAHVDELMSNKTTVGEV